MKVFEFFLMFWPPAEHRYWTQKVIAMEMATPWPVPRLWSKLVAQEAQK